MNIFVLSTDPRLAAQYHCDKHVVKMVLETAQMLSTALRSHDAGEGLYRKTHANHPCTVWARTSRANFDWLCDLGIALSDEYSMRYDGRVHKSTDVIRSAQERASAIPAGALTPFAQAMPAPYRDDDAVEAYRAYYIGEKSSFASWARAHRGGWTQPWWWPSEPTRA